MFVSVNVQNTGITIRVNKKTEETENRQIWTLSIMLQFIDNWFLAGWVIEPASVHSNSPIAKSPASQ